jgi:colicin import membrane protein
VPPIFQTIKLFKRGKLVSQTDIDIQLQVWKDLAISKQILMGAATDALGLDAQCSTDELKSAMNKAIKQAKEADITVIKTREQAEKEISEMKALVATNEQARLDAEEQVAAALKARETAERQLSAGRSENAEALKKARADVADKQNKLKAISKALADTPENVVKKLKTLKKQKMDESRLRTQTESKLLSTRKDKTKLEGELKHSKSLMEQSSPLIAQLKELHAIAKKQSKKIKSLSDDKKDVVKIPKLDEELIETIEKAFSEK